MISQRIFSATERKGLVEYLNSKLLTNIDPETDQVFHEIKPGVLLCKLVNAIEPDTIKTKINESPKSVWDFNINHEAMLEGAKQLGCNVINIGAQDITDGTKHLILGIFWQVVRVGLLKTVRELSEALGLELDSSLPPEQILLMWLNYHLKNAKVARTVTNFGEDLKDGEVLTHVLHQIAPKECDLSGLGLDDSRQRASKILEDSDKLGCRKFITPDDLVKGNARLNLAYVAGLFSKFPEMGVSGRAADLEEEVTALKKHLAAFKKMAAEKQEALIQKAKEIATDNRKFKETLVQAKKSNDHYKSLAQQDKEENDRLRDQIRKLAEENEALNKTNAELTQANRELEDQNEELTTNNDKLQAENEDLRAQLEAALRRIKELEEEIERLKAIIKRLEERVAQLESQIEQLKAKLTEVVAKTKEMMQKERDRRNEALGAMEGEKGEVEGMLQSAIQDNEQLNSLVQSLQDQLANQEQDAAQKAAQLESELAALRNALSDLNQSRDGLQAQLNEATKKSSELNEKLTETSNRARHADSVVKRQKEEITGITKDKDGELEELRAKNASLKQLINELNVTIMDLQKEIQSHMGLHDSVSKSGWLVKKSPNQKFGVKLQKRYFVLKGLSLLYYKTPKDNMSKPTGQILVDTAEVHELNHAESLAVTGKESPYAFEVKQTHKTSNRTFLLIAATQEERKSWCEAIVKVQTLTEGRRTKRSTFM